MPKAAAKTVTKTVLKTLDSLYEEAVNLKGLDSGILYDTPVSCTPLKPFDSTWKGNIVARLHLTFDDIMKGDGTLEEKLSKFTRAAFVEFGRFGQERDLDYRRVRCMYYGTDWNRRGNYSTSTIKCTDGFVLLPETLERTTTGDWKGGPDYNSDNTQMNWTTGGHGSSSTFARIWAEYKPTTIKNLIRSEMKTIQDVLLQRNIPSELPPQWED